MFKVEQTRTCVKKAHKGFRKDINIVIGDES